MFQVKKSTSAHLSTIADFAIEMFDVLDEINYQSYNDFILRVGKLKPCTYRIRQGVLMQTKIPLKAAFGEVFIYLLTYFWSQV